MSPTKPACDECPNGFLSVFCQLGKKKLHELGRARTVNQYRKGSVIFYEGNPCLGAFCVFSGKVKIWNRGVEGHLQIARLAKGGDLLGYRALLAGEAYAGTAEVIEKATICFIEKDLFVQAIRENPEMGLRIMRRICQDLRSAEKRALDLIQRPVAQRLAVLLLDLMARFGEKTDNGAVRIGIELTRGEMAEMAGTTTETVIRTLGDFRRRKVIDMDGHATIVRNLEELRKLVPDAI